MKKQLLILLLLMLLPIVAGAQKYVPVQKGDKWGVQKNGEWTIKPKYLSIQPFGKNFVVKAKHHEKEWKQKWMLLSPEGQDVLNRDCWKIEIYDAQAAIVNEANIINTEGKVLVHAFKVKPTEIPGLLFCSNYPKDFYFSLVSGEKYTFQGGKIQRLENDLYYVYKITSHTDSGKRLIPGTKYQYIVTGTARTWTTKDEFYYQASTGMFSESRPNSYSYGNDLYPNQKRESKTTDVPKPATKLLPNLSVVPNSLAFIDATGNNAVHANGSYKIRLQVKNTGKGDANGCTAKVTAKGNANGIKLNHVSVGNIPMNGTKTVEIPITSDMTTTDGHVEFAVQVDEPHGLGTDAQYITVNTRAYVAPLVQVTDYTITADGGRTLRKKEPFDLQLMVQNTKQGRAEDVSVTLTTPSNIYIVEGEEFRNFKQLTPGETKSLIYSLIVNNNYQGTTIPIQVKVKEKYGKYAESRTITLKLDQAMASTKLSIDEKQQAQKNITIARLGSDVDKDIPKASIQQQKAFAVIITNEHYTSVSPVPYAKNDGQSFANYCCHTLGLPQQNIRTYQDATYGKMLSAINDIKNIAKAYKGDINVIFYYAGHGIPNEQSHDAYLLPIDGDGKMTDACYSLSRLYQELESMNARQVIVFMDACFSGSKRGEGMLALARGVAIKVKEEPLKGNTIVFSAASGDETAYPYQEQEHGLFTYFLLKKLKETQGSCTLGELCSYIQDNVSQTSIVINRKSQTPTVKASASMQGVWRNMKLK